MDLLFASPHWIFSALLVTVPSILFFVFILWIVRKTISTKTLRKNHDVAGFTFSIIAVLYSVILGFTVINVQNRYATAEETAYKEAMILADMYRETLFLAPLEKKELQTNLREYVSSLIHKEWPYSKQDRWHLTSSKSIDKLWSNYHAIPLNDEKTKIWYEQSTHQLEQLLNSRLFREFNSWEHLGSITWSLLIIGAIITMGFMFFFGLENFHSQALMVICLAGYLSFILYLIFSLDNIYRGPGGIKPVALEQVVTLFDQWDLEKT